MRLKQLFLTSCTTASITGSALALHCCKAHAKINMKIKNSTPCKIVTHEDFNLKLSTRDYVWEITRHAAFWSNRSNGGFPPNRGNITRLWLFCYPVLFSRSWAQVEPMHIFLRWMAQMTCFRPKAVLLGSGRWVTSYGENMPQKLPQKGRE